ncbi:fungal-specific transcription factor domain-containing protein [Xylariaceae sp. FL1019]|nr:fungal-specific transcription factor domain-containing protein [Xylariaceae sp. FL1019]
MTDNATRSSSDGTSPQQELQYFTRKRLSRGRGLRKTTGWYVLSLRTLYPSTHVPSPIDIIRLCQQPRRLHSDRITVGAEQHSAPCSTSTTEGSGQHSEESVTCIPTGSSPGSKELYLSLHFGDVDEAAAALVGIRGDEPVSVDDTAPTVQTQMVNETETETDDFYEQRRHDLDSTTDIATVSPNSTCTTLQVMDTSPNIESLDTYVNEQRRADGECFQYINVEDATQVWASLLLRDASMRPESVQTRQLQGSDPFQFPWTPTRMLSTPSSPKSLAAINAPSKMSLEPADRDAWQSPVLLRLETHECTLFHNFIRNLSLWMDFFDPKSPFGTLVPHLAMRNRGLLNAILALSVRHLSLNVRFQRRDSHPQDPVDALTFYFTTLHYIREAMQYESYKNSLELLATASIVSAYEMLEGSRQDWERHLRGLSCIQHSQGIHGDSGGLKQAVWWAWLCQDVWAAWREGRKPFTTWKPDRALSQLDSFELARRSIYHFGQAVGFCCKEEVTLGRRNPADRLAKAEKLQRALRDWRQQLPGDFDPLPLAQEPGGTTPFEPIWIHPPCFGIAVQLYHCSQILIMTNSPTFGMREYNRQRRELDGHVRAVCGLAMHLTGDPDSVMCSQALFIAGLFVSDASQRNAVLDMLQRCWQRAGWPQQSLGIELEHEWRNQD